MGKTNSTANDAQLKARRTSLGKKSKDELINIILRKDSTERKNNVKIQELTSLLKEADSLNEEKATRILGFEKDMKGMEEIVKTKQEQIDALISEKNTLAEQVEEWSKKYVNVKNISSLRRKVIFTCFGIITILIVLFFLF
jgi:t-SNARE complex subunit (syntaxin)